MVEAICHASKELGLPSEVMRNVLRLIRSVETAVHDDKIGLIAEMPQVDQAELLESLIQEYCQKL